MDEISRTGISFLFKRPYDTEFSGWYNGPFFCTPCGTFCISCCRENPHPGHGARCARATGLDRNPLHLIERDLVAAVVVELRCPGRLVCCDGLGVFDRTTILQIRRNASCPEGVAGGGRGEPCLAGSPFDHPQNVRPRHRRISGLVAAIDRAEEGSPLVLFGKAGFGQVSVHIGFGVVVGRHLVKLAALLVQAEPPSLAVLVLVRDLHASDGSHAGERVAHDAEDGSIS